MTWADGREPSKLNILVNNAAQTLTDPVSAERKAIANEDHLRTEGAEKLIYDNRYSPKIRGGAVQPWNLLEASQGKIQSNLG